jgi:hypothetical protein
MVENVVHPAARDGDGRRRIPTGIASLDAYLIELGGLPGLVKSGKNEYIEPHPAIRLYIGAHIGQPIEPFGDPILGHVTPSIRQTLSEPFLIQEQPWYG